tara:strand:- start:53 stop:1486 length:1434 start_codon:yes stop_codon:yes gene_type:complete
MKISSNKKTIVKTVSIIFLIYFVLNFVVGQRHYNNIINLFPDNIKKSISKIVFPIKYIKSLQSEINYVKSVVDYWKGQVDLAKPYGKDIKIKTKLKDLNYNKYNSEFIYNGNVIKIEKFLNYDPFLRGIQNTLPGSAYLDIYDNKIFIASTIGILGFSNFLNDKKFNFKQIQNNIEEYLNITHFRRNKTYSVRDVKLHNNKVFISFIEEVRKECWSTSVLWAELNYQKLNFEKLFSSSECVDLKNIDGEFNASQSGGRIIFLDQDNFLLSIGDYRVRYLAQKEDSIFGKIIKFNIKDKKYKIISMGHRNPQGLLFDKKKMIALSTEHGPMGGDEVNLIQLDEEEILNYGWPIASYGEHYPVKVKSYGEEVAKKINENRAKKYPLLKSHRENGFIEPLKNYTPSIGMSEIVQINDNTYLFASMKDRSIYFFKLNDKNQIEKEPLRINIGERIRDIAVFDNEYYLFLEDTGSIARFTIN